MEKTVTHTGQPERSDAAHAQGGLKLEFRGKGGEYFRIWIVNVLLSIVTLGIYSAWAKVRTARYFYANTYLDETNFRYLGAPVAILKGRAIAVAALMLYVLATQYGPATATVFWIALFVAAPYFVIRALAFNRKVSAYKNIQFRFKASYREAFTVMYVWPLLGVLTLGILIPFAWLKLDQFLARHSSYGTTKFDYIATYLNYGGIVLVAIILYVMASMMFLAAYSVAPVLVENFTEAIALAGVFIFFMYFKVRLINIYYSSLALAGHRFDASISVHGFAAMYLVNGLLSVVTIGLYLPVAKVNIARYVCSNISMLPDGRLDNFVAAENENVSALGEEFASAFDLDV